MNTPQFKRFHQVGFTLVELMVSIVIGLLIVLALITLVVNVSNSNNEMSKTNRTIENGRFALQLLESDLVHAGYWGGFVPSFDDLTITGVPADVPNAVPDPCLPYTTPWSVQDMANFIGIVVQSYEIPATVPSPTLSVCASKVVNPKAETDVLFVRHLETCVPGLGTCPAVNPGDLYFQVARCGEVATSPNPTASNPAYAWAPYPTASSPSNAASSPTEVFPLKRKFTVAQASCTNAGFAELHKFVSNLYYIRDYANAVGDGIPTLMRSEFGISGGTLGFKTAEAMIEGIEGFRVELGVDGLSDAGTSINLAAAISWANAANLTSPTNRGDGIPDGDFVHCTTTTPCTKEQLTNVVAVKLYVLVRSDKMTPGYTDTKTYVMGTTTPTPTLGPFNDGYKRHLFTQTIRLTNISSRRETP